MQDQPTRRTVAEEFAYAERIVLEILLEPGFHGTWTLAELARAYGDEAQTVDALAGLHAAGLVHRCGEFVFASRAAARLVALERTV
jgi:hypothetical protein